METDTHYGKYQNIRFTNQILQSYSIVIESHTICRVTTYPQNPRKAPKIEKLPPKMLPKIFELAKSPKIFKKYPRKSPKISTL